MSRYLTPTKVGVLLLAHIHLNNLVTSDAVIPLLSFITEILIKWPQEERALAGEPAVLSIQEFESRLKEHSAAMPGRSLWDLFVQHVWSLENLDALHAFIDAAMEWLTPTRTELLMQPRDEPLRRGRLSRNSPLGIFVRRCQLEFMRLKLHDTMRLWNDFVVWREGSFHKRKQRRSDVDMQDGTLDLLRSPALNAMVYQNLPDGSAPLAAASSDDFLRTLNAQVDMMQRTGLRVPVAIRERVREMLTRSARWSHLGLYQTFLDAWRSGDYVGAFDTLHRYFDYAMLTKGKLDYHYALLTMAFVHADFGCYADALAAIKESIAMARESRDVQCLNFNLSWLYHFGKQHPEAMGAIRQTGVLGTDREAVQFIKSKAREAGSWTLHSICLLAEVQLGLSNGESIAAAFDTLAKITHLTQWARLKDQRGQKLLVESALFVRLGYNHLEHSATDTFDALYAADAQATDRLDLAIRIASRRARTGQYELALASLQNLDPEILRIQGLQTPYALAVTLLQTRHEIYRTNYDGARRLLSKARALAAPSSHQAYEAHLLAIELAIRTSEFAEALSLVEEAMAQATNRQADVHDRLYLMVVKARVFEAAGVPQKGFTLAIRAASAALKARILDVLYQGVVALARVLISVGEWEAAAALLEGIMPAVLESEDRALAAQCYMTLADAEIGIAGHLSEDTPVRRMRRSDSESEEEIEQSDSSDDDEVKGDSRDEAPLQSNTHSPKKNRGKASSKLGASSKPNLKPETPNKAASPTTPTRNPFSSAKSNPFNSPLPKTPTKASTASTQSWAERAATVRNECFSAALAYLGRAIPHFVAVHDVRGQLEATAKRCLIMRAQGDTVLAEDEAAGYVNLNRKLIRERGDGTSEMDDQPSGAK